MKKIYLLLAVILVAFSSCGNDDVVTNPAQIHYLSEYCGFEVRSKMTDGSTKNIHYYLSLYSQDTTYYNVSVSKNVYNQYGIGDIIECEEENNGKVNISNAPTDGGYKIVMIGGENYMVIKLDSNISVNDTTLTKPCMQ